SPVPYSGKIDIRGVNYFGEAQFAFSLHDGNGTTHWRNGNQPGETIKVTIRNGRYNVLLGGQGMNSLPPELFLSHDKLYLKVEVDMEDGGGLRHLAPDQLITATPRALVADIAKVAELAKVAKVAEKVGNGVITRDMLSSEVLAELDANGSASPSAPITITRDMLPQDVRDDLNRTVTITRSMLPADVLADLNKSSTTASPITLSMLAPEVTAKLDQNGSGGNTTIVNPPVVGSTLAVPHGESVPAGYSLYHQVGQPKELVWEEKAPVSVARFAYDGVEVLDGKIYFVGGKDGSSAKNIAERYDPVTNTWETLAPMLAPRNGVATAVLDGKLYAIGGTGLSSVEVFDPLNGNWSAGVALPSEVSHTTAITVSGRIYLVGGRNASDQNINQVLSFDLSTNQWTTKANMPTARHGAKLVWFENRIWAIAGWESPANSTVESYDPQTDSWRTEKQLPRARHWPVAWVSHERIYVGGLQYGSHIDYYDSSNDTWTAGGNLPENKFVADAVVLNDKAYVIAGQRDANNYSNKVFAADLNASVVGVYDLYRKDGNASAGTPFVQAEVADGSVTTAKLDSTILKYLKPEITAQPQVQTVYTDSNATFSVTAEGKYLAYQWKKDGVDLTGETNATLTITDANATQHDGNYSVVVSNDFGSLESWQNEILIYNSGPVNGLVAWWKFDEGDGTVAYDSSGNGHDLNLTNGPTWTTGEIGGALSFDGVDDFVQTSVASNSLPISISTWIYTHDISGSHSIVDSDQGGQYGHSLIIGYNPKNGNYQIGFHDGFVDTSHPASLNQWTHTVVLFDSNISFFADGIKKFEQIYQKGYLNGTNFRIGRHSGSGFYAGLIDDVRIYDRALSADEVQALYSMGQ
ncbi:immunoglobulin domain-containing protein, partial [Opitutales bacterium]|nr:immunoglobulin domain-containing protein [Opitutales bacterium]